MKRLTFFILPLFFLITELDAQVPGGFYTPSKERVEPGTFAASSKEELPVNKGYYRAEGKVPVFFLLPTLDKEDGPRLFVERSNLRDRDRLYTFLSTILRLEERQRESSEIAPLTLRSMKGQPIRTGLLKDTVEPSMEWVLLGRSQSHPVLERGNRAGSDRNS